MSINRQDITRIALLARLDFDEHELEKLTEQLSQIVDYVHQLNELDTEGVQPMAHAIELANVFAEDIPQASLDREAALGNAPKRDEECYLVPAVLGEV